MNPRSLTTFAIVLASCSSNHSPAMPPDGGVDPPPDASPDAPPDASGPPPNTVIGKSFTRCHQVAADVEEPSDLSASVIQALIPDGGPTGYRIVAGRGRADGSFTIEGVPDGITYLLQFDHAYYATARHDLSFFSEISGRCVPAPAIVSAPTPVTFQLTGMTPYAGGLFSPDNITAGSVALGASVGVFPVHANDGNTTLATTFDWSQFLPLSPLPDASAGDDFYVLHTRRVAAAPDPATGRTHQGDQILDTFQTTGVTLHNGAAATVTGAFQHAALNKTLSFSLDRGLFDAGRGGAAAPTNVSVAITAQPVGHDGFFSGTGLTGFDLSDFPRSTSLVQTVASFPYADPFPASWQRTAIIDVVELRSVRYPDPKATGFLDTARVFGFNRLAFPYTGAIDATPMPKPTGAKLGGVDFLTGGLVKFDGQVPVEVTWNPVPSAMSYRIDVIRVNPPGTGSRTTSIALLRTADTSLKIPASLFSGGQFFVFVLNATRSAADYGAGQISATAVPFELASVASGRFRLSATCGDGVVQPGEDCDAKGETATCNRDCTTRFCGDGLRNAAAGEACDTVDDALGCDSDCTLPVCGDGHVNRFVEDCDDGNATDDHNGCGANCKFNNVCGNHIVESAAEACDTGPGDSKTCDSDCTAVVCGDGHVNRAAGEECDGTDGCSTSCKLLP